MRAQRGDIGALPGVKARAANGTFKVEGELATAALAKGLAGKATGRLIVWMTPAAALAPNGESNTGSSVGWARGKVGDDVLEREAEGTVTADSGTGDRWTLMCTTLSAMPLCCIAGGGFKFWGPLVTRGHCDTQRTRASAKPLAAAAPGQDETPG